jgi:hypothetical protein
LFGKRFTLKTTWELTAWSCTIQIYKSARGHREFDFYTPFQKYTFKNANNGFE